MIETINGKAYLKVGDKVYELGGGSNIIAADSVEQLPDPASVPEGTIALVKSEEGAGGGGLPVVELETVATLDGVPLSDDDAAKMNALNGGLCIITANIDMEPQVSMCGVPVIINNDEALIYSMIAGSYGLTLLNIGGTWMVSGGAIDG